MQALLRVEANEAVDSKSERDSCWDNNELREDARERAVFARRCILSLRFTKSVNGVSALSRSSLQSVIVPVCGGNGSLPFLVSQGSTLISAIVIRVAGFLSRILNRKCSRSGGNG